MKRIMLTITALGAAVLAAGCSSAVHPAAAKAPAPVHYSYSAAPSVSAAPATTVLPGAAVSPLQNWWDNGASTDWSTVEGDLTQLQSDSAADDLAAAVQDGGQLRTDALAAAKDEPPSGTDKPAYYFGAMGAMAFAGLDVQFGNFTKAAQFLKTGTADVTKFEAEALSEGLVVTG